MKPSLKRDGVERAFAQVGGDKVKVILREAIKKKEAKKSKYPLRGKPVHYERPFDNIAEEDWAVLRWSSLIPTIPPTSKP